MGVRQGVLVIAALGLLGAKTRSSLQFDMAGHFLHSLDVLQGLTTGELEATREAFGDIAKDAVEQGPHMDAVRKAALVGASAADLRSAGIAFGTMAKACGGCHVESNGGPSLAAYDNTTWEDVPAVRNHAWGADLMWLSLVKKDPDAWSRSLELLETRPRRLGRMSKAQSRAGRASMERARKSAEAGGTLSADAYADVLMTCASCHS